MSRIGNTPVAIDKDINVSLQEGNVMEVKGPKGTLTQKLPEEILVVSEEGQLSFKPANDDDADDNNIRAKWGLARALVNNMVVGVKDGFTKELEINGVGYKAVVQGKTLKLSLGYSHDIDFAIPEGIKIEAPKPTELIISGIDKQAVGQTAAKIREYRKPEPYKGKGIKYKDEYILRKEGKKK
jgi:large subunit ribosomal protein L6